MFPDAKLAFVTGIRSPGPQVPPANPARPRGSRARGRLPDAAKTKEPEHHDLLKQVGPFAERGHYLMAESTRTRARSPSMIGIGSCWKCCSSRIAACPPVVFTASSPPAA
jgi:hypothetical protein